jgi:hypothetical protein
MSDRHTLTCSLPSEVEDRVAVMRQHPDPSGAVTEHASPLILIEVQSARSVFSSERVPACQLRARSSR